MFYKDYSNKPEDYGWKDISSIRFDATNKNIVFDYVCAPINSEIVLKSEVDELNANLNLITVGRRITKNLMKELNT